MNAPCIVGLASSPFTRTRTREAWTAFWQEPGQSRCIAGATDVLAALDLHWTSFAPALSAKARVLDLGCGAGAVGRALLAERRDLHITGVDFAKIPLTLQPHLELLSDVPMESLPFADASFAAATSQFGFEYSQTEKTAAEMARVLAPGAPFSFLIHHAGSAVVANDRARLAALLIFLDETMRSAFCAGEASFTTRMASLQNKYPHDALVADLANALSSRLSRAPRERLAIWTAVEDALAPELCLAKALNVSCVAADEMERWIEPLRADCTIRSVTVLPDPDGDPIAWRIEGARR
jgi:SAM-dependent methyltransferase